MTEKTELPLEVSDELRDILNKLPAIKPRVTYGFRGFGPDMLFWLTELRGNPKCLFVTRAMWDEIICEPKWSKVYEPTATKDSVMVGQIGRIKIGEKFLPLYTDMFFYGRGLEEEARIYLFSDTDDVILIEIHFKPHLDCYSDCRPLPQNIDKYDMGMCMATLGVFSCTRANKHEGNHCACAKGDHKVCEWRDNA